jgi:hypothetical protein
MSEANNSAIYVRDKGVSPTFGSFVMRNNFTQKHRFDEALIEILSSVYKISSRYGQKPLPNAYMTLKARKVNLSFHHLFQVNLFYIFGILFSTFCFFAEVFLRKFYK